MKIPYIIQTLHTDERTSCIYRESESEMVIHVIGADKMNKEPDRHFALIA